MSRAEVFAKLLGMTAEDVAKLKPAELEALANKNTAETFRDTQSGITKSVNTPAIDQQAALRNFVKSGSPYGKVILPDEARAFVNPIPSDAEVIPLKQSNAPQVDEVRAKQVAKYYDTMKNDPTNPDVKKSYDALIKEVGDQYKALRDKGLDVSRIEPGMENPYKNSSDLIKDVRENNKMSFFPTDQGFGTLNAADSDNPLLRPTEHELDGKPLLANDLFRIVHDYHGHVEPEMKFGARGEEGAWQNHMNMFSPEAQKALTTETRGQNSWVNFGPHGEANRANPANTIYADQKTNLLPDWAMQKEPETGYPVTHYGPEGVTEAQSNLHDWEAEKNVQPTEGINKYTGRIPGEVYDLNADPKGYYAKAKRLVEDGKRLSSPEDIARQTAKDNGYAGMKSDKGIESFQPVKLRPSYGVAAGPLGMLSSGFDQVKEDIAKPVVGRWEKIKDSIYGPLSQQMNLTKDPEQADTIRKALNMVADPANLVDGPAALGVGAMQLLGSDEDKEK